MTGGSAFRRLLLDTVSTAIAQPPSSSSLIELLRIATPSLLASSTDAKQREGAGAKVRDKQRRDKLFRTLQLRIHPDKHAGEYHERATVLFQDVTTYYTVCVDVMEEEDRRQRWSSRNSHNSEGITGKGDVTTKNEPKGRQTTNPPRRPSRSGATTNTHSDYENAGANYDEEQPPPQRQYPGRRGRRRNNNNDNSQVNRNTRQPSSHQAFAATSTILFPPLGLCSMYHSYQVKRAWQDGRFGDARDHSDQAYNYAWYGCLIFVCVVMYLWLRDGDWDWDWDKIKDDFGWDDGP